MADIPLFEHGGVVMVVLVGLSIYAVTIILYKAWQFMTANVFKSDYLSPIVAAVHRGELLEAQKRVQTVKGPVARVVRTALGCVRNREMTHQQREAEISRIGAQEMQYMESHMRGLEMVATTAPLLGLLGTVIGMVHAFSRLSDAGTRVDPSMLAGGIWEALLTTVGGLSVAIPAIIAYYFLDGIIERVRATMKDVATQVMNHEDVFLSNDEEQARIAEQRRIEQERRLMEEHERRQRELMEREQELKEQMMRAELEQQQAAAAAATAAASAAPQAVAESAPSRKESMLHLLNPTYSKN